jgi:hypothetical protein
MKRICKNCQYWRDGDWCSNSKSSKWLIHLIGDNSCNQFYAAGLKAPLWLRLLNKIMGFVGK